MNISAASRASGLSVKTVRYYGDIGLLKSPARTSAGYRTFDNASIRKLIFIRRSREFGFTIKECRELLDLYQNQDRNSAEVKNIASKKLVEIEEKQKELQSLHDELANLVKACRGDNRPDCPIIDYLG